jgi:type II secretory pathway component GspD/PulD (secretin)
VVPPPAPVQPPASVAAAARAGRRRHRRGSSAGTSCHDAAGSRSAARWRPERGGRSRCDLLNFEQADIREVIYTFAAALSINYWLDPRVQGQVTARSFGPIYVDDLYPVFMQILRSNGYAAVKQGDLYMIVPAEEGKTRAPTQGEAPTCSSSSR